MLVRSEKPVTTMPSAGEEQGQRPDVGEARQRGPNGSPAPAMRLAIMRQREADREHRRQLDGGRREAGRDEPRARDRRRER